MPVPADMLAALLCLLALAAAIDRRHAAMAAWLGVATAIGASAWLTAPFFLATAIARRMPARLCALAPLAAIGTALGLRALGLPHPGPSIIADAPSLWAVAALLPAGATAALTGLALATAIGATGAYVAYFSARRLPERALPATALLAPLMLAVLLPGVQAGDFLVVDVFALVYAGSAGRTAWPIAALVLGGSLASIIGGLLGMSAPAAAGAAPALAALWLLAWPLLRPAANDNPILARPV